LVKAVSKRLAAARTLSFVADETIKTLSGPDTSQVQRHRSRVTLERPDKLRVVLSGGGLNLRVSCNGNTMMRYSPDEKALVIDKAPPSLGQCLSDAFKESAADAPLVDLVATSPYGDLTAGLKSARYLGSRPFARTSTDVVAFVRDGVSVEIWVGTEDKLPRVIHATYVDEGRRVRRSAVLSEWQIDVPVDPAVFTSLNPGSGSRTASTEPRPVGTSGFEQALKNRPLSIHSYSAKYWGSSPSSGVGGGYQTPPAYYSSADGYDFYGRGSSGFYPQAPAEYSVPECYDCVDEWTPIGSPVPGQIIVPDVTAPSSFNLSFSTSTRIYPRFTPRFNVPGRRFTPGQIVTSLPVGCSPYTGGPAFYLCDNAWFAAVFGPDGNVYYRVISAPWPY